MAPFYKKKYLVFSMFTLSLSLCLQVYESHQDVYIFSSGCFISQSKHHYWPSKTNDYKLKYILKYILTVVTLKGYVTSAGVIRLHIDSSDQFLWDLITVQKIMIMFFTSSNLLVKPWESGRVFPQVSWNTETSSICCNKQLCQQHGQ